MAIEGRLLEQVHLDNELTVYFYDESKPVVGNRWQVRLHIIVPVMVKEQYFASFADPPRAFQEFTTACGDTIQFTLEKIRNFVDDNKVAEAMEQMKQEFLTSNQTYMSSPRFSERLTMKKYTEFKASESCRERHIEAVRRAESRD